MAEQHILEAIKSDVYLISFEKTRVGQVNGLSIYDLGDYVLGKPSRITSLCSISSNELIDIERTSKLSGKIHSNYC